MSDPRDPLYRRPGDPLYDPADPLARAPLPPEEPGSTAVWGWVAGIIVVIAVLAVVSMRSPDTTVANRPLAPASETTGAAPPPTGTLGPRVTPANPGASMTAPERAPSANPAPVAPSNDQ